MLLLTHDNKGAQISSHVAAGFLQVFPNVLRLLHNFLLMNQRMSQVVSLSHMLGVPQSSKTGAEKFRKSNRL